MRCRSVGLYFRDREDGGVARALVEDLEPGATLLLEREPENKYDGFAIKVLVGDVHIGYLPARQTPQLAPMLEDGQLLDEAIFIEIEVENRAAYPVMELQFDED